MMEDDKTRITWNLPRVLLPKNRVKLLLNLLLLAGGTIPRGGSIALEPIGEGDTMGFKITSTGLNARIAQAVPALARVCGMTVTLAPEGESIVLTAR